MKRLLTLFFCILQLLVLTALRAQMPIDNVQLYGTGNQVTSGSTLTALGGATVDFSSATVVFANNQISAAKVSGLATVATSGAYSDLSGNPTLGGAASLSIGTTAGTVAAGDDSRIVGALTSAAAAATYQPLDSDLTSIAALATTTFGRSLLTQADASATRTTLGLGTAATTASSAYDAAGAATTAQAAAIAASAQRASNLSDLANAATARTNLGLGTAATTASTAYATAAQGTKADAVGAVSGLVKSNGTATFSAATAGTDYLTPTGAGSGLTSLPASTGLYPTLNQNTTGTAANVTGIVVGANGGTGVANTGKTITLGGNLTTSGAFATTLTATGTTTVTLPTTGTLATTGNLSQFAATTSAQLAGVLSDETGTGSAVFAGSPALTGTPTAPTAAPLNNSTQLSTTAYADAAVLIQQAAQLQHDGYIQSDGATPNRAAGIYGPFDAVNNPRECIAGAASLTIAAVVTVPTSAASSLWIWSTSTGAALPHPDRPVNSLGANIFGNTLTISQRGPTQDADTRNYAHGSFRSTYSGQTGLLKMYFVQGTTNPVVTWNGVDISASFTPSTTGGTPAVWLDAAMVPTYRLVGYNWPSGPAPIVTPILGATSAADDAFYLQTGKWPAWVVAGGSMQQRITDTARNSVFSAAGTDWERSANGSHAIDNANGELDVTCTGDGITRLPELNFGGNYITNDRWFIATFTIANWSMTAPISPFLDVTNIPSSTGLITGNGTYTLQGYRSAQFSTGSKFGILNTSSTGSYSVKNVVIRFGGALSLPAVQPINVLDDVSGIGGNQGRILGCTPVVSGKQGIIRQSLIASSYLHNAQVLIPSGYGIDGLWVKTDGGTVSLGGSAGAPNDVFSSFAPASGVWTRVLNPGASSTGQLYCTLGTATYAQFRILLGNLN